MALGKIFRRTRIAVQPELNDDLWRRKGLLQEGITAFVASNFAVAKEIEIS